MVEPTTATGGAIWAGDQAKQSHRPSMGRATSVRTGIRENGVCVPSGARPQDPTKGVRFLSPELSRGGIGPGHCGGGVSSRGLMVPWASSGQGDRPSCGCAVLGTRGMPRAASLPSTCWDADLMPPLLFIFPRMCGLSLFNRGLQQNCNWGSLRERMRERERIAKSKCQRLTETSTLPARPLGAQTQPFPGLMEKAGPCPTGGSAPACTSLGLSNSPSPLNLGK